MIYAGELTKRDIFTHCNNTYVVIKDLIENELIIAVNARTKQIVQIAYITGVTFLSRLVRK